MAYNRGLSVQFYLHSYTQEDFIMKTATLFGLLALVLAFGVEATEYSESKRFTEACDIKRKADLLNLVVHEESEFSPQCLAAMTSTWLAVEVNTAIYAGVIDMNHWRFRSCYEDTLKYARDIYGVEIDDMPRLALYTAGTQCGAYILAIHH